MILALSDNTVAAHGKHKDYVATHKHYNNSLHVGSILQIPSIFEYAIVLMGQPKIQKLTAQTRTVART